MNIKRSIDKNGKLIIYVGFIIIFAFIIIKTLNLYYKDKEEKRQEELSTNVGSKNSETIEIGSEDYTTESNVIEIAMHSFVNYCNNKELDKAYAMLTDECKEAMFPTVEDFERIYINNIYNIERTYDLLKWTTEKNKTVYLVTLYGDLLATGGKANTTQEYYTFVEGDDGIYKININNYIYGEEKNVKNIEKGITVTIDKIDVYNEYEVLTITITNNTSKSICLTGNKYRENIYLENATGITYSPLNSEFESKELILETNESKTYTVNFNKVYSSENKAKYVVLSDIILDYGDYSNSEDKTNYSNRTSLKIQYSK